MPTVWPLDWRMPICWLRVSSPTTVPDTCVPCCCPPPSTLPSTLPSPPALEQAPSVASMIAAAHRRANLEPVLSMAPPGEFAGAESKGGADRLACVMITIATIGYEGATVQGVTEALTREGVALLVDVRA